ncbi:MAG: phosphopyruvate hydratase [Gammaproteobacteria bacterium]|nr:phosphopyruvate hydratase [Gammaproteobacteria bacterium]
MSRIDGIRALEVLDSRGSPTLEVEVSLANGSTGRAMVPSGASVGSNEALELRDGNSDRFFGKGVLDAICHVHNEIQSALVCESSFNQSELDSTLQEIDGTQNKTKLGANATLGVSLAFARAEAQSTKVPLYEHIASLNRTDDMRLPVPMMNVLNGGAHANNRIDLQEFMIVPTGMNDFSSAIRCGAEVFHCLKNALSADGHSTAVGDEGGFAPDLDSDESALAYLADAIERAGYKLGSDVHLALDCAATEFHSDGDYFLQGQSKSYTSRQYCDYLAELVVQFPIVSIEDGLAEEDWNAWRQLTARLGSRVQLVGDDIFVTNPKFLQKGIELKVANSILIKVNQIGTLTETLEVIQLAKSFGYNTVISHRSGDTEDTFIADLAVGTGAGQIKSGSLCRSERTSKYNRLIRIEADASHLDYRGLREII